jgi:hypothetical protein
MSSRAKLLIAIGAVTFLGVALSVGAYYAWASNGTLIVDVHEKGFGGDQVHIEMPGALLPITMAMIPDHCFMMDVDDADEFHRYMPMLKEVWRELELVPDAVLVSVETPDEVVLIEKKGEYFLIDVDSRHESVRLSIPVKAMGSVIKKMERASRYL